MRLLSGLFGLLIVSVVTGQTPAEQAGTIAYLKGLVQPDGSIAVRGGEPAMASLRSTSAGVRAIKYFGAELPDAKKTAAYVLSCYDAETGAFRDTPKGQSDVVVTAIGMMAAAEVLPDFDYGPSTKYLLANAKTFEERRLAVAGMEASKQFPKEIDSWLDEVRKTGSSTGTFGGKTLMPRETGSKVAMILRAGKDFPPEQRTHIIKALQEAQREDGAYGQGDSKTSDLDTTYRVMRTLHLLKAQPNDVKAMRAFVAKCRNSDGGYGAVPGQSSAVNSTYYAGVILHWLPK